MKRKFDPEKALAAAIVLWAAALTVAVIVSLVRDSRAEAHTCDVPPPVIVEEVVEVVEVVEVIEEVTYEVNAPWSVSETQAVMLAKLAWGEARGCTTVEQAAVMWCVLNRVDDESGAFPDTVEQVITQPHQFYYSENFPLRLDLYHLALDVLSRWQSEHYMLGDSGRVLPREYLWFGGEDGHNWFRRTFELNGHNWDWSLPNPYEGVAA
jgi:hypothetical protein